MEDGRITELSFKTEKDSDEFHLRVKENGVYLTKNWKDRPMSLKKFITSGTERELKTHLHKVFLRLSEIDEEKLKTTLETIINEQTTGGFRFESITREA